MKERLLQLDRVALDAPKDATLSIIKEALGPIVTMRRVFRDLADGWSRTRPEPPATKCMPPALAALYRESFDLALHVDRLADGIAGSVSVHRPIPELPIQLLLQSIAWTFIGTLATRRPCRCGVEIGMGAEMEDGDLVSSSWVKAYLLESKYADWCRVLIGPELVRSLEDGRNRPTGSETVRRARARLAAECLAWLVPAAHTAGWRELNYLHPDVFLLTPPGAAALLQDAFAFVQTQERQLEATSPKHAGRARQTLAFMREHWPRGVRRVDMP